MRHLHWTRTHICRSHIHMCRSHTHICKSHIHICRSLLTHRDESQVIFIFHKSFANEGLFHTSFTLDSHTYM